MVEMIETADIMNQATPSSLVILDEVGRGTSTHDGLAIAQACMEHLHGVGCRTLFATHFHELAEAAESLPNAACMMMDQSDGLHGEAYSHRVRPGKAGRSHGLKVARMAGMPETVLNRAEEILGGYLHDASPMRNAVTERKRK